MIDRRICVQSAGEDDGGARRERSQRNGVMS